MNEIEEFVNNKIDDSIELIENRSENYEDAVKKGVVALFNEKYGKTVRSVKFGNSYELCGGTHVKNTIQIRNFVITSESSIASGIRRIEAISGPSALEYLRGKNKEIKDISNMLSSKSNLIDSIKNIKDQNSQISKDLKLSQIKLIDFYIDLWLNQTEKINSFNFLFKKLNLEPSFVKSLCLGLARKLENHIIILITESNNRFSIFSSVSESVVETSNISASEIIKSICNSIGGSGGGQVKFAAGSGPKTDEIELIISKLKDTF